MMKKPKYIKNLNNSTDYVIMDLKTMEMITWLGEDRVVFFGDLWEAQQNARPMEGECVIPVRSLGKKHLKQLIEQVNREIDDGMHDK